MSSQFTANLLWKWIERVRDERPLVHCITNQVAVNFNANVLLAIGAIPAMVIEAKQVDEFIQTADVLSVNLGTLTSGQRELIELAVESANKWNKPWVLDPVGVGLKWTREFAIELLAMKPTVIRGNPSEIVCLVGGNGNNRGPDSLLKPDDSRSAALSISKTYDTIVCATGERDLLVTPNSLPIVRLSNGDLLMTKVTAIGCSLSAVVAAFVSVASDPTEKFVATVAAHALVAIAGELAAKRANGPGSFVTQFVDQLYGMQEEEFVKTLRLEYENK
ncbi:Hydroxyethylthiazole kinase [Aphelenchoides besseyi]|nr:Hydroxyethylthiazole kinase [Aphelenchoides besseyi]